MVFKTISEVVHEGDVGADRAGAGMKKPDAKQLDLFVTFVGDVPVRDEREAMSLPLASLGKRKRVKPIEWTSRDGKRWCRVSANPTHGMATVFDLDVILWCVSQLNEAVEHGLPTSPMIQLQPYELLRAIHRDVGGDHYKRLEAALNRLTGTLIETNIRGDARSQRAAFHWLEAWTHDVDEATGRSRGMTMTLPLWLYRAVVEERAVLAVSPDYFKLSGGIERWLYRLARRHAGKQVGGWRFTMRDLHERSGSSQPFNTFARDVRRVVAANTLPEYSLEIMEGQRGDELVAMNRDPARVDVPQKRTLRRIRGR